MSYIATEDLHRRLHRILGNASIFQEASLGDMSNSNVQATTVYVDIIIYPKDGKSITD